jgi:CRISPR-associated protein (TIGR03986 family)
MPTNFVQHQSPQNNNIKAKSPYNFVPLPERILPAEEFKANDKYHADRHTGHIKLKIKSETPLYTRCAFPSNLYNNPDNLDENGKVKVNAVHECQDFFHHGNNAVPVIPGSTLRGMTRSLVEILAYTKVNFVNDSQLIHRAVADTTSLGMKYRKQMLGPDKGTMHYDYPSRNLKGGYLEIRDGKYYIRPAMENNGESFVHIEQTALSGLGSLIDNIVYVDKSTIRTEEHNRGEHNDITLDLALAQNISGTPQPSYILAKLVKTKSIGRKHMDCAVFEPDSDDAKLIRISDEMWRIYKDDRDMQRGIKGRRLENHGDALFYLLNDSGDLVFFGPTMMFRLPYTNTVQDFIPEILSCSDIVDLAETIFGTVESPRKMPKFDGRQLAGRVFFSDAICITPNPFFTNDNQGRFVPKILSSPKPTSFQLYLNQPVPNSRDTLRSYYDAGETVIRGSKCYWHKKDISTAGFDAVSETVRFHPQGKGVQERKRRNDGHYEPWKESKQHTIIKPVKKDTEFVGKVYFENLLEEELGALLTALELPETKRHRIGMAKPYGLGSVEIETELILQNQVKRYASLFDEQNHTWCDDKKNQSEIAQIKENATNTFKTKVLTHYNNLVQQSSKAAEFWQIPRLQALSTMLEWETASNFHRKEYAGLQARDDKTMWRGRHVLPYPQNVQSNSEPKLIQVVNSNLWAEECLNENLEEIVNESEIEPEPPNLVPQQTPTIPLALLNLPSNKVASELHQHYQDWLNVTNENLKLEIGKVIVEKGKHWSNAKKKDWFIKIVEFIEKNK